MLDEIQIEQFSRQILVPEIGGTGQEVLLGAGVAIQGEGPIVAPLRRQLTAMGVGVANGNGPATTTCLSVYDDSSATWGGNTDANTVLVRLSEAHGEVALVRADETRPCGRCRWPLAPKVQTATIGSAGFIASAAATETVRLLLNLGSAIERGRFVFEGTTMSMRYDGYASQPDCHCAGEAS